jgi:hypothetical protein
MTEQNANPWLDAGLDSRLTEATVAAANRAPRPFKYRPAPAADYTDNFADGPALEAVVTDDAGRVARVTADRHGLTARVDLGPEGTVTYFSSPRLTTQLDGMTALCQHLDVAGLDPDSMASAGWN